MSEKALQIAEERREVKGKGERERYTQLKADFQRTARRDKKAFLNEQCKEIERNSRTGNTSDLFKKITDIKGTFHARMGAIKDRNSKDPAEAEEIKKRWQEYREELYKKGLNDLHNHDAVVTYLEPNIVECDIKGTFSSVQFSRSVMSNSLRPHESQHARPPCPSPTPGVHSDSRPSSP